MQFTQHFYCLQSERTVKTSAL